MRVGKSDLGGQSWTVKHGARQCAVDHRTQRRVMMMMLGRAVVGGRLAGLSLGRSSCYLFFRRGVLQRVRAQLRLCDPLGLTRDHLPDVHARC